MTNIISFVSKPLFWIKCVFVKPFILSLPRANSVCNNHVILYCTKLIVSGLLSYLYKCSYLHLGQVHPHIYDSLNSEHINANTVLKCVPKKQLILTNATILFFMTISLFQKSYFTPQKRSVIHVQMFYTKRDYWCC